MACYIITYDLRNAKTEDYEDLISAIKKHPKWGHISESVWAVVPHQGIGAATIRDELQKFLKTNDRLFVIKSGVEAAWRNSLCQNEWLKENL